MCFLSLVFFWFLAASHICTEPDKLSIMETFSTWAHGFLLGTRGGTWIFSVPPFLEKERESQTLNGAGIFTYIWLIFMVNVGKYTIHWVSGNGSVHRNWIDLFCLMSKMLVPRIICFLKKMCGVSWIVLSVFYLQLVFVVILTDFNHQPSTEEKKYSDHHWWHLRLLVASNSTSPNDFSMLCVAFFASALSSRNTRNFCLPQVPNGQW